MHGYSGKLLELLSIENESEKPTIYVRLTLEQKLELKWELDQYTASHLQAITEIGGKYTYRLSFQSHWDSTNSCYYSSLTKTYLDQSEKIYFACSTTYIENLKFIKLLENSKQVLRLPPVINILSKKVSIQKPKETRFTSFNITFSPKAVAMISFIAVILMGFSSYPYITEEVVAKVNTGGVYFLEYSVSDEVVEEHLVIPTSNQLLPAESNGNIVEKAPSLSPQIELEKMLNYSIAKGNVALTFDDGPSKYTKAIADILNEYQVSGTFFFIGQNVKKHPDHVAYVHANGFSVGNHSMNHADFSKLSYEQQKLELKQTNELIEQITTQPVFLFRPPYGAKNEETLKLMEENKLKMVLWNRDTEDWRTKNAKEVLNYVVQSNLSGAIILLHESKETVDALPDIIRYLQEQRLQIISLK